jgi:hypothetical protein
MVNFGPLSETLFIPNSQGYTLYTQTVTLTAPAQLSFQNVETGDVGAILDNVSVISTTATVTPEPSTLCLAGLAAVCGISYALVRKLKAQQMASIEAHS